MKEKYLKHFNELIVQGEELGFDQVSDYQSFSFAYDKFNIWRTECIILLQNILPTNSIILNEIKKMDGANDYQANKLFGFLVGCKKEFENGFLDDLSLKIENEISVNYLEQAEAIIRDKDCSASHIPAAVLAGAVLEKTLRTLCEKQTPPIKIKKSNGDYKTATPLAEDLCKNGVVTAVQKKKLDLWIKIRNDAAHGHIENISVADVKDMINGITDFLDICNNFL